VLPGTSFLRSCVLTRVDLGQQLGIAGKGTCCRVCTGASRVAMPVVRCASAAYLLVRVPSAYSSSKELVLGQF
jgi:hypothetical protein